MLATSAADKRSVLSIVFTSFALDRLEDICHLLTSIGDQTYPHLETVFVADQSRELAEKVTQYAEGISLPIRVLFNQEDMGVNVCLNIGIRAAQGSIVAQVDDDVVLFPDWAEEMLKSYSDPSVVGVTGPALPLWEDEAMSWFPQEFYWMWGCTVWDWEDVQEIRNVGNMNCSFTKEALLQGGLYRPGLGPQGGEERIRWLHPSGEEVELSLRIRQLVKGAKIIYNPKVKVYHKVQRSRFNWGFIVKRAFRFGYSKHFVEELFRHDYQSGPVLNLERDHLRHILWRMPLSLLQEFPRSPLAAGRKLLVAFVGTFFAVFGYGFYFLKPVRHKGES